MEKKDLEELPPPSYNSLKFGENSENLSSASSDDENLEYDGAAEFLEAPTVAYVPCEIPRTLTYSPPLLDYDDIYEACIRYVTQHCCYGSKFVKEMNVTCIKNESAFHYILETFCEKRQCAIASVPYIGQSIDGPENGPSPGPWDVIVEPPAFFKKGKAKVEIPHTAYVRPCEICRGSRLVRCKKCSGGGRSVCSGCSGSGQRFNETCVFCTGSGRKRCSRCKGSGKESCQRCDGMGHFKSCGVLIVRWFNCPEEILSNTHNLPLEYVKNAKGCKMLCEEQQRLTPLRNAPDEFINEASKRIMNNQRETFRHWSILKQRHVLRAVPLTRVFYECRGKHGEFYVYGKEKDVFFQKYPQKFCCCTCL